MADFMPILRRSKLFLFHLSGDGPRFAAAFADAWRQLPLGARRRLLKFWRETRPIVIGHLAERPPPWPHIELISPNLKNFTKGNSGDTFACTAGGRWFAFDSPTACVLRRDANRKAVVCTLHSGSGVRTVTCSNAPSSSTKATLK
jgi:hypothetical protein